VRYALLLGKTSPNLFVCGHGLQVTMIVDSGLHISNLINISLYFTKLIDVWLFLVLA
jgi:hypothetical protein